MPGCFLISQQQSAISNCITPYAMHTKWLLNNSVIDCLSLIMISFACFILECKKGQTVVPNALRLSGLVDFFKL